MTLPLSLEQMLNAWNEHDLDKIRGHLDASLAGDVIFADPNYFITGIDAFEKMVIEFRQKYPTAVCSHSSGYDSQHDRYRYQWTVSIDKNNALVGYDVTTINAQGLVERVDGFFGELPQKAD
ncbi:MAG: hypothetical protein Alis2KO_39500 [Aliiglaciecola sp.]